MQINSVVIHEIIKEANTMQAEVFLTDELLDIGNEEIKRILTSLEKSFTKHTPKRAKFSDEGFKDVINDFSNFSILEISRTLTKNLKDSIKNISSAKGGYFVFTEFENNHHFLAVFLVRNVGGNRLVQSGESWNVNSMQYLDVEHLAMGVKINLSLLNSNSDDRYISLVRGKQEISRFFENWVGIDDIKQESKDANALYEVSNQIGLSENVTRDEFKKKIYEYAKSHPSNTINIRELSGFLYEGDQDRIPSYCQDNDIDIDGEFKLTGKYLSKFYKVSVKADGIELSAPRNKFNPNMITASDGMVIIHSANLAQQILDNISQNE